ncbi:MAG TPA: AMP-binding protein [Burkholderiaceae bacterium]
MELYSLNCAQLRLWKIEQTTGAKSKPNEVLCLKVPDDVALDRIVAVVKDIVRERYHYHSTLAIVDGSPFWRPGKSREVPLNMLEVGLNGVAADDDHGRLPACIHGIYRSERTYAFNLESEFPVRMSVARHGAQGPAYLYIGFHPLVMTRAKLDVVFRLIESRLAGGDDAQPDAMSSFGGNDAGFPAPREADLLAFRRKAAAAHALQDIPTDRMRDAVKRYASTRHEFSVAREKNEAFRHFLRVNALPEDLGWFAVFAVVAGRCAQQGAIHAGFAGSQTSGQGSSLDVPTLFDHAMIEAAPCEGATFADFVNALKSEAQLGAACCAISLESFLEERGAANPASYSPFCQIAFEYRDQIRQAFPCGSATIARIHPLEPQRSFSHSEIEFRMRKLETGELRHAIEYSPALFDASTIHDLVRYCNNLVDAILAQPGAAIAELDLMDDMERQRLSASRCDTVVLPAQTLDSLFCAQAARTPDAIALVEANRHISFSQLDEMSARLARQLAADGIVMGDRVGVYLPRSVEFVACVLGILRCGAVYVPLDVLLPMEHARFIETDGKLKYVLHCEDDVTFPGWRNIRLFPHRRNATAPSLPQPRHISDPAYLMYTSGSTGKHKGVIGTHKSVVNRVIWGQSTLELGGDDIFCMKAGASFVDHVAEMFQALLIGRPLFIVGDNILRDTTAFIVQLSERQVTRLTVTPVLLSRLMENPKAARLQALKSIICSGERLTSSLARRVFKHLRGVRLFNIYGLTEAGADCSFYEIPYEPKYDLPGFFQASQTTPPDDAAARSIAPAAERQITYPGMTLNDIKKGFLESLFPKNPLSVEEYRSWLKENVLPFSVNVSSSKFVGHMTSALPDFMSEMSTLISSLNQNMVKIETSKALTFLERQLLATLHREFYADGDYDERIQNPDDVFGLVVSGGSSANITAMWNARNRALLALGFSKAEISHYGATELLRQKGYQGFAIIASGLAHYSMRKAVSLLDIGERNLLAIRRDARQKADLADLESKLKQCREKRLCVIAIIGIAGATETGTIDPLADMAAIAAKNKVHFHVDAAWGGAIAFSEKYKPLLNGIERADSITLCPHKQFYVPQGMSLCLFKDSRSIHASSVQAVYQGKAGSFDMGQYTIEGSRPAIFLSLHAMFNIVSRRGVGALVELGIEKTHYFADVIVRNRAFEIIGFPEINILNYRYVPRDLRHKNHFSLEENRRISEATAAIQERQFLEGKTFVSKTDILNENYCPEKITVFRVVISNPLTTHRDLIDNLENQLAIADAFIEDGLPASTSQALAFDASLNKQPKIVDRYDVPIGRAIANTEILILDKERRLLPAGAIGEIFVGGEGVAIGYLCPDETRETFVPHPFKPGASLVRTGDYGRRLADGNLHYCGRKDQKIKVRGTRIELGEVEASLYELEEIAQCVVLAEAGEADTTLIAFVVLLHESRSSGLCEDAIRRKLAASMPSYLVPEFLHIVDALPLTPRGKIDRQELHRHHWNRMLPASKGAANSAEADLPGETASHAG